MSPRRLDAVPDTAGEALWYELPGRRRVRRLITVPGLFVATALVAGLMPVLIPVAAARDLARRQSWPLVRFVLGLACALLMHVVGLAVLLMAWIRGRGWHGPGTAREQRLDYAAETWWACAVWRMIARIWSIRLEVDGDDHVPPGPALLLMRHASLLDTLLPIVVLSARHGLRPRFVMKRELLWDPCLDVLGHRVPTAFVHRGGRAHTRDVTAIEHLLTGMGPGDIVVLYPEGTRFSEAKRQRLLEKLARRHAELWARAERLRHVLPPHPGGVLGLLEHGCCDVVFCAHTGLESANHLRDLASGALLGNTVRVVCWRVPAAEIPSDRAARLDWLHTWWARVDEWIDIHHGGAHVAAETSRRDTCRAGS